LLDSLLQETEMYSVARVRLARVPGTRLKFTAPEFNKTLQGGNRTNRRIQGSIKHMMLKNKEHLEADHDEGVHNFTNFTTLERQMESLSTKGFLRSYKPYSPPADITSKFLSTCSSVLGRDIALEELRDVKLDNLEEKFKVLEALSATFNHSVHNSRLGNIKHLKHAYVFYQAPVITKNPYELLHERGEAGGLPPNLHIQLNPFRFTGKGEHRLDQVTAYPRSSTLVSGLYTRDKYKSNVTEKDIYEELDYK